MEAAQSRIRFLSSTNEHSTRLLDRQSSRTSPRHRSPPRGTVASPLRPVGGIGSSAQERTREESDAPSEPQDDTEGTAHQSSPPSPSTPLPSQQSTERLPGHAMGRQEHTGSSFFDDVPAAFEVAAARTSPDPVEKNTSSTSLQTTHSMQDEDSFGSSCVSSGCVSLSRYEPAGNAQGVDVDVDEIFNAAG